MKEQLVSFHFDGYTWRFYPQTQKLDYIVEHNKQHYRNGLHIYNLDLMGLQGSVMWVG